jgi:hypothetical protein
MSWRFGLGAGFSDELLRLSISTPDRKCIELRDRTSNISITVSALHQRFSTEGHYVKLSVRSVDRPEIWDFDIPPTPYTTTKWYSQPDAAFPQTVTLDLPQGYHEVTAQLMNRSSGILCGMSQTVHVLHGSRPSADWWSLAAAKEAETDRDVQKAIAQQEEIARAYTPLRPDIRAFSEEHLHPALRNSMKNLTDLSGIITQLVRFVYGDIISGHIA